MPTGQGLQKSSGVPEITGPLRRIRALGLIMGEFMLVQGLVQAVQAITGIIIIRGLTKHDYALYTIANTWLAALLVLSDSGVGSAATALGGTVWQDRHKLGQVISSALRIRHWLAAVTVLPIIAVLAWTLARNGASWSEVTYLAILVGVIALFQLTYAILVVVLRLRREVRRIQVLDIVKGVGRLIMTATAILIYFNAVIAQLAIAIASAAQCLLARKWMRGLIDPHAPAQEELDKKIKAVVLKQWPNEVNGVFSGQLSIILLSVFGTVASVANLGALGRISMLFGVFTTMLQSVVLPRYACCQDPARLKRLYFLILAGSLVVSLAPVLLTWIAPGPFLWILGPKYKGLNYELILVVLNTGLGTLNGLTWNLNAVRAWIMSGWWLVPVSLAVQFSLMAICGVSTIPEVLLIGIASSLFGMTLNITATFVFSRRFTQV